MSENVDVLAVRRAMTDVIADAVRLLELPEFRQLLDAGSFSFPAATVIPRLMSCYVNMVHADDTLTTLVEVAERLERKAIEQSRTTSSVFTSDVAALRAALARAQGGA